MSAYFTAGVLNRRSWHGEEQVLDIRDSEHLIELGRQHNVLPVAVVLRDALTCVNPERSAWLLGQLETAVRYGDRDDILRFAGDLKALGAPIKVPGKAVVAKYQDNSLVCHGAVGDRYRATPPDSLNDLFRAAGEAGGKPCGIFSLKGGSIIVAQFEVDSSKGFKTFLNVADSLNGSTKLLMGGTDIRTVCWNTFSAALRSDGKNWAASRHTGDMAAKATMMEGAIHDAVEQGTSVREAYEQAKDVRATPVIVSDILEELFPTMDADGKDFEGRKLTIAKNAKAEVVQSMQREENKAGSNLATVWNGLTWAVDRDHRGKVKGTRGGDAADSMLFGTRGKQVAKIGKTIQRHLADASGVVATAVALQDGSDLLSGLLRGKSMLN